MFVAITHYNRPLVTGERVLLEHYSYLDGLYANNLLLCSGPRTTRTGGVLILVGDDDDEVRALLDADPLTQQGVIVYELVQFWPTRSRYAELIESPQ